eukprot:5866584-Pyramimonas_sp.AAC.2
MLSHQPRLGTGQAVTIAEVANTLVDKVASDADYLRQTLKGVCVCVCVHPLAVVTTSWHHSPREYAPSSRAVGSCPGNVPLPLAPLALAPRMCPFRSRHWRSPSLAHLHLLRRCLQK